MYCFRAEYTPTGGSLSKYLPASHTNKTTECFEVIPAGIDVTKTADDDSVSAGDPIGFTVGIFSTGPGTAAGVKVTDTLPTTAGTSWSIDAAGTTGSWSITNGVLSFGGANGVSMPAGTEYHAHIVSPTTPASCGTVDNSADATTTNDGTDSASASVEVLCPDVKVTKTPDGGSVQAGDPAVFTIVVENIGDGIARDVHLTDTLPVGYTWTPQTDVGSCSITTGVLDCSFGDMGPGAKATVTLTAPTSGADCATIPNTASATSTNEAAGATGNNSDSGSIDVLCASIEITKTANPVGPVSAGDTIGFDIVVANNGDGEARNVHVTDTLPTTAGTSWSVNPAVPGCSISAGVLTCDLGTMAAGAQQTIHLTSGTTAASCSVVDNTASVTTSNDGSDSDDASVTVLCPDVAVTKTADPAGPVNAGDQIGFDVTISNLGQGTAYDASATDTLPAGIDWAIDGAANGWSLSNGVLSFGPTDLAAGASASVRVVGTTDAADCGVVPNTVTATAPFDPNPSNDSASASVVVNCPDVLVIKTADLGTISAGEIASFTIEVANLARHGV